MPLTIAAVSDPVPQLSVLSQPGRAAPVVPSVDALSPSVSFSPRARISYRSVLLPTDFDGAGSRGFDAFIIYSVDLGAELSIPAGDGA
jgi:hypothetical protein